MPISSEQPRQCPYKVGIFEISLPTKIAHSLMKSYTHGNLQNASNRFIGWVLMPLCKYVRTYVHTGVEMRSVGSHSERGWLSLCMCVVHLRVPTRRAYLSCTVHTYVHLHAPRYLRMSKVVCKLTFVCNCENLTSPLVTTASASIYSTFSSSSHHKYYSYYSGTCL